MLLVSWVVRYFATILRKQRAHGIGDFLSAGRTAEVFGVRLGIGGDAFGAANKCVTMTRRAAPHP